MPETTRAGECQRLAIEMVARTAVKPREVCGWGVFQEERTNNRRDWPSGYTYTQVSAIFQRDLPVNSLEYLREHRQGEFVICEVSRI